MMLDTNQFQFAHGKQPRGVGLWAFNFVLPGGRQVTLWHNGPFGQAAKLARLAAKQLKAQSVSVGS